MSRSLPTIVAPAFVNPRADRTLSYGDTHRQVLNHNAFQEAAQEISTWPGYQPTPLRPMPGLAAQAGVDKIYYKDEGGRFGLGSFKALGGAYAVSRLLRKEIARRSYIESVTSQDLIEGKYLNYTSDITVTCATDGNHGRSVAWGAQLLGCRCVIYVHATVSEGRVAAIARYGAEVVRTQGNYDQAVRQAATDAEWHGRYVVSDTSYPGYTEVPKDVMQGYTVMVDEIFQQLPNGELPTHVFLCAGVGGMAAAVCGHLWERYGEQRPRFVVVEPDQAACVYESLRAGQMVPVIGELDTLMAGLACGEVSVLAWEILKEGIDAALVVDDQAAVECMRLLARGGAGDEPLVAGESAVAGLAGFIAASHHSELRQQLGIDSSSRILLFGTEGATDPELYARLVGVTADQVGA